MGTSVVGQLAVLLKADSAQFESDLGKARAAVAATTAEFKVFGKVGVDTKAAFIDTTGGLEEQMKGSRAALGILTQGLREMGGAAAAEFGRMSYHLAHVAEGAGLVGISMAAIGLSVMAVTKSMEAFRASNELAIEGAEHAAKEQGDVLKRLDTESRNYADAQIARARGVTVEEQKITKEIERARVEYEAAASTVKRLTDQGVKTHSNTAWYDVDFSGKEELLSKSMGAVAASSGVIEEAEKRLTQITAEQSQKRIDLWATEAQEKTLAAARFVAAQLDAAGKLSSESAMKQRGLAGLPLQVGELNAGRDEAVAKYLADQNAALDEGERHQVEAANHVASAISAIRTHFAELRSALTSSPEVVSALAAINTRFDAMIEKAKTDADVAARTEQARLASAAGTMQFELREIEQRGYVDRYALLFQESEAAVALAEREGKNVETVRRDFLNRLLQLDVEYAQRRAETLKQATRSAEDAARGLGQSQTMCGLDPHDQVGRIRAQMTASLAAEDVRDTRQWQDRMMSGTSSPATQEADYKTHLANVARIKNDADTTIRNLGEETNRGVTRATEDFWRGIENLSRTSLDAQIADENVRYARQVEDEKGKNADLDKLAAEHQAKLAEITAQYATVSAQRRLVDEATKKTLDQVGASFDAGAAAARRYIEALRPTEAERGAASATISGQRTLAHQDEQANLDDPSKQSDFFGGFHDRIQTVNADLGTTRELGAQIGEMAVKDVSSGLAGALNDVATGAKSAKQAFEDFARSFLLQIAKMIEQALIAKAVGALLGGVTGGGAAPAGDAAGAGATATASAAVQLKSALAGTWSVGGAGNGFGAAMRAPNVSGSDARKGGGDFNGTLIVRPPAVVADDVMARASPDAKAAVVASSLRQSGRRGFRPRD
jgi:lambda family phage tail tape measure protein